MKFPQDCTHLKKLAPRVISQQEALPKKPSQLIEEGKLECMMQNSRDSSNGKVKYWKSMIKSNLKKVNMTPELNCTII